MNNLGIHYANLGRHHDALPPTEEAVTLYRDLAADNPAHLPNLAMALSNLGNHYAELGRYADALPPTEEAVTLYRDLAADNPAHRPNLAMALNNLGNRYANLGRYATHDRPRPPRPKEADHRSTGTSPTEQPRPPDPTSPRR